MISFSCCSSREGGEGRRAGTERAAKDRQQKRTGANQSFPSLYPYREKEQRKKRIINARVRLSKGGVKPHGICISNVFLLYTSATRNVFSFVAIWISRESLYFRHSIPNGYPLSSVRTLAERHLWQSRLHFPCLINKSPLS